MSAMKIVSRQFAVGFAARAAAIALAAACVVAPGAGAQNAATGSIEFVAQATPASGIEEPVRGFPFYVLTRSYQEIQKEAQASDPAPNLDAFIDKLDVSKELKAWMKKNHSVQLSGDDFVDKLTPEDVVTIPEFYTAYLQRSQGAESPDFPKAKFKPVDKTKDPEKYDRLSAEYHQAVKKYIDQNPKSKEGMDVDLLDQDPTSKWQELVAKRTPEIRRRTMELAQSKYFVAQTQTNLQGQGFLNGIPAGTYWLSTLDLNAEVGDVRARWDVPVTVRPGQTARVVLSNVNSVQSLQSSP
jgi:hypothetical protein